MLIVKKYGGSSVSSPKKILAIAKKLKQMKAEGHALIVVVSAMGDTTDELIALTQKITQTPIQREMDMLLSSGERISMALLAIALNSLEVEAVSFTGSQSGVLTDQSHGSARIDAINAFRVKEELNKGKVVIVAGFQGVSPKSKEITTLGRGGSDTTAVALAAAFNADRCDILTDVEGIFSIDPRVSGTAPKHYETLDFDLTLDMAYWGARVLHYRSVELAERNAIPLSIKKSHEEGRQTTLGQNEIHRKTRKERAPEMEMTKVLSVNTNTQILNIRFLDLSLTDGLQSLMNSFENSRLATPQIIYQRGDTSKSCEFFITLPEETFDAVVEAVKNYSKKAKLKVETSTQWATISITGRGFVNSNMAFEMSKKLAEKKIYPEGLIVSPLTLSVLVQKNKAVEGAALLHREFVENATANG